MGNTNIGNQLISYNFKEEILSKGFNKLNYKIHPRGVYHGGLFSKIDDNNINISPMILLYEDSNNQLSVKIETLDNATVEVSNSNVFIVGRFTWINTENNFLDFLALDEVSILDTDIIFGRVQFNGLILTTNFDYSRRTIANNIYYDFLNSNPPFRVIPTFPYSNSVRVLSSNGEYIHNGKKIEISSSILSPSFSFPVSINGRKDLVGIDSNSNSVVIIQGNDDSENSIPSIPYNILPVGIISFPPSTLSTVRGSYIEYLHPFQCKTGSLTDDDVFNLIKPLFTLEDGLDGDSIDGLDGSEIVENLREMSNITGISIPLNQGFPYDPFVVPENMIILYSSDIIPEGGIICDGNSGTPNLLDRYLFSSESFGVLGGTFTHDGGNHGIAPQYNIPSITPGNWSVWTTSSGQFSYAKQSHAHTLEAHGHSGIVNHEPLFTQLIPIMGLNHIYKNAILLSINSLFIPGITRWKEMFDRYIKMAAFIANGGSNTHNHDNNSLRTGAGNAPTTSLGSNLYGSAPSMSNHKHYAYHRHTTTNNPLYKNVLPYRVIGDRVNTDLESGTIGLFTDDNIPSGWQKISYNALLRLASTTIMGGVTSHNHLETPTSLDSSFAPPINSQLYIASSSSTSGSEKPKAISHSHGIGNHSHSTLVDSMPPYVGLVLAIKQ